MYWIICWCFIGSSNDSFIAIDDVKLADCEYPKPVEQQQCSSDQYTCKSKHCVPAESLCDMNNDCCDGSDEVDQSCSQHLKYFNIQVSFFNYFLLTIKSIMSQFEDVILRKTTVDLWTFHSLRLNDTGIALDLTPIYSI